jgi:uncharacterized protein (TIGR02099 family)
VRFDVQQGVLDYAPGWPRLDNTDAQVVFDGRTLTVESDKGGILSSALSQARAEIPDLLARPLRINFQGDITGATQDKIDYLRLSPALNRRYGRFIEDISVEGDSVLQLKLGLEVTKEVDNAQIDGWLKFADNHVSTEMLGKALTHANGKIRIDSQGLQARGISAQLFGQPTQISVDTKFDEQKVHAERVEVVSTGRFDAHKLSEKYLPVLVDLVDGQSDWRFSVNIPVKQILNAPQKSTVPISISAESYLKGVDVRLPPPFNKNSDQQLKTKIVGRLFPGKSYRFRWNYGNRLDGIVEYDQAAEDVLRGELRFGGGPVVLPAQEGFRLVGHLNELSIDVWRSLVTQIDGLQRTADQNTRRLRRPVDFHRLIHSADLTVDHFQLFGQDARNMSVKVQNNGDHLLADVNSDELRGKIKVPSDLKHRPIDLQLDRWELTSSSGAGRAIDPRQLPAINAFAKSVSYKKRRFGSVRLKTTKLVEGLRVEQLIVKPRATSISAFGKWVVQGGRHQSNFELHLDSEDLGATMQDLDYVGSIIGGAGKLDANLSWQGPLTKPELQNLQGDVSMHFEKGKLLEVDSGAGRLFGLFSLQTLPRRLILDFSDLYEKGIEFNVVQGHFIIDDGDAYTNDFSLAGPGAKAHAAGRIGLATQDYDQLLTFIPQTADVASVIGSLLVASPWAFVIPQIFKENINKAMSIQYTLSGSWNNPTLERVSKNPSQSIGEEDI